MESPPVPAAPNVVALGQHHFGVVPQPHTRLTRGIPAAFSAAAIEGDSEGLARSLGDSVWNVLRVFIPDLMPEHEFNGYAKRSDYEAVKEHRRKLSGAQDAHEAQVLADRRAWSDAGKPLDEFVAPPLVDPDPDWEDPYEEEFEAQVPTLAQIIAAFEVALKVNRIDLIARLKEILPEGFIQAQIRQMAGRAARQLGGSSPLSPSASGAPALTNGTPPSPTPPPPGSEAGPSPASSTTSPPQSSAGAGISPS